ncbi:hypothetical protein NDU88_001455 [Pleurodeles waltl]|uniref:Uncharacterized protein n=1 Tax=Pleurodeles waltl TaxID=8319 RepID=A0AAV7KWC3_PLEWA|nr:hypothetical protein NDU88_001455 [Pleurodeles waltl]
MDSPKPIHVRMCGTCLTEAPEHVSVVLVLGGGGARLVRSLCSPGTCCGRGSSSREPSAQTCFPLVTAGSDRPPPLPGRCVSYQNPQYCTYNPTSILLEKAPPSGRRLQCHSLSVSLTLWKAAELPVTHTLKLSLRSRNGHFWSNNQKSARVPRTDTEISTRVSLKMVCLWSCRSSDE